MQLKDGVIMNEMDGKFVAVDAGAGTERFNGILNLNKTAAFVVKQLEKETTLEEIVQAMTDQYDVTAEVAEENAKKVIEKLQSVGLLKV
ncbi:MAG: PqqD family protein [Lachnospiraceae bacterium]|nr:PqqD family protein [Lachnospiraceae bacterium]